MIKLLQKSARFDNEIRCVLVFSLNNLLGHIIIQGFQSNTFPPAIDMHSRANRCFLLYYNTLTTCLLWLLILNNILNNVWSVWNMPNILYLNNAWFMWNLFLQLHDARSDYIEHALISINLSLFLIAIWISLIWFEWLNTISRNI